MDHIVLPKGLVVTPNLPQLQNIYTAMIRTSCSDHNSVRCWCAIWYSPKELNFVYALIRRALKTVEDKEYMVRHRRFELRAHALKVRYST